MQNTMLDSVVSSNSQELSNASSAIKLFENPQFIVRVIMRCADPWFVAKDACDCLDLGNVSQTCSRLDDDERGIISIDTEVLASILIPQIKNATNKSLVAFFRYTGDPLSLLSLRSSAVSAGFSSVFCGGVGG